MKRFLIPLLIGFFGVPISYADTVVKCTTASGVIYQSEPCTEGMATLLTLPLLKPSGQAEAETVSIPPAPLQATRPGMAATTTGAKLPVGMSDLQILNHRSWGKPQHIRRSRAPRAWHEYWDYQSGENGGKQLHFINGTLVGIVDLQPSLQITDPPPVAILARHLTSEEPAPGGPRMTRFHE